MTMAEWACRSLIGLERPVPEAKPTAHPAVLREQPPGGRRCPAACQLPSVDDQRLAQLSGPSPRRPASFPSTPGGPAESAPPTQFQDSRIAPNPQGHHAPFFNRPLVVNVRNRWERIDRPGDHHLPAGVRSRRTPLRLKAPCYSQRRQPGDKPLSEQHDRSTLPRPRWVSQAWHSAGWGHQGQGAKAGAFWWRWSWTGSGRRGSAGSSQRWRTACMACSHAEVVHGCGGDQGIGVKATRGPGCGSSSSEVLPERFPDQGAHSRPACLNSSPGVTCSTSGLLAKAHKTPTFGTARFGSWARPCRSRT